MISFQILFFTYCNCHICATFSNPAIQTNLFTKESALLSAVRRQMDAFEEKWEKKLLSGDDEYWLNLPPRPPRQFPQQFFQAGFAQCPHRWELQ